MNITFNPTSLDFRNVAVGQSYTLDCFIYNDDGGDVNITAMVMSNPQFTNNLALGILLQNEGTVFQVVFTPSSAVTTTATMTCQSTAANNPVVVNLTGTGVGSGKLIGSDPPSWDFGSQKDGVATSEKVFVLKNNGTATITITGLTFTAPFSAGPTQPALNYSLLAGATVGVGMIFTPSGSGFISKTNALIITSDASGSPTNFQAQGTGYAITSAYNLINASGPTLVALGNVVRQFDPLDLDCEESCSASRLHNFEEPAVEKTLERVYVFFEKYETGTITLTVQARTNLQTKLANIGIDIPLPLDNLLLEGSVELIVDGEQIELTFSHSANGGSISITEYQVKYLPFAQLLGTSANPGTANPFFTLTGALGWLAAFSNGSVKQFNVSSSFGCEEQCSTDKLLSMEMPALEKTMYNAQVDYEDLGPTSLIVQVSTRRGDVSSQTLTLGTIPGAGSEEVLREIANLDISEEVMHLQLVVNPNSGPLSLLGVQGQYEPAGETRKDS